MLTLTGFFSHASFSLVQSVTLGPGTADLRLRVGIHSGPVTAGVLRGERSRFQLFGVSQHMNLQ